MAKMVKRKEHDETGRRGARSAFYLYCIGGREELASLVDGDLPPAIESESNIRLVAYDDLAAVVSDVPLSDYAEDVLQSRLSIPAWTASRAMRHKQVVEYFAARASVIPLRFGTIYIMRERIEEMLTEKREELRTIVERVRGCEEWSLVVYCDRAKLKKEIVSASPRLRELSEEASKASPGQAFLIRKKIDALRADETSIEIKHVTSQIERELASACKSAKRLPRMSGKEATERGELIVKIAFLVERERFNEFRTAAERLAEEYVELGFHFEMIGPMPAYNFVAGS